MNRHRDTAPHFSRAEQERIAAALTEEALDRALNLFMGESDWRSGYEEMEIAPMLEDVAASIVAALCPDLTPGTCRVCSCTDERACEGGCSWADYAHTLCSGCV